MKKKFQSAFVERIGSLLIDKFIYRVTSFQTNNITYPVFAEGNNPNLFSVRIVFGRKSETKNDSIKNALIHVEVLVNQFHLDGGFTIKGHSNAMVLRSKVNEIYNKVETFVFSSY